MTDPPVQLVCDSQPLLTSAPQEKSVRHPWCDTNIIINKIGDARKGQKGRILDVLINQHTSTGIMLVVQLVQFNPVTPFPIISIDCDYVVESL